MTTAKHTKETELRKFFAERYQPIRLLGCPDKTLRRYKTVFNTWARFLGREPTLGHLTDVDIAAVLTWYHKQGRTAETVNTMLNHIMALARYAAGKRLIDEVPDVLPMPEPVELPSIWTPEEVGRILDAARELRGVVSGMIPACRFWPALLLIAYDTGLRAGAIWQIQIEHIDLERRTIYIPAACQKNRRAQMVSIHPETIEAIRQIIEPERKMLFPWGGCESTKYNQFNAILKRAGLPAGRKNQLHRLRRTCASLAHSMGIDATAQLGHSSDQVTRRHYLNVSGLAQAASVLPRPWRGGPAPVKSLPEPEETNVSPTTTIVIRNKTEPNTATESITIDRPFSHLLVSILSLAADIETSQTGFMLVVGMANGLLTLTWRKSRTIWDARKQWSFWDRRLREELGIDKARGVAVEGAA